MLFQLGVTGAGVVELDGVDDENQPPYVMYSFAEPVTSRIMLRGSARPLASTTMTSRSEDRCASLSSIVSMSLTSTAQHRQPLLSETIESTCPATIIESMLTDPKSLTITPIRAPRVLRSRWLSRVVFPDPRKPATITTGIRVLDMAVSVLRRRRRVHPGIIRAPTGGGDVSVRPS